MIKLVHVEYQQEYNISCVFSDGMSGVYDLKQLLLTHNTPLTEPLREINSFRNFFLVSGALCWKNGLELDPQSIYRELQQEGKLFSLSNAA
ncbi:MAG TPA: DUF2442 domain-containing protein [Desulfobacter postgatei]|nr:DUF2442 domain-containing protein [Desulfobacter postgatei]